MKNKKYLIAYIASFFILVFLFFINYTTSWVHPWIIYPAFAILWWPLTITFSGNKTAFSVAGSVWISIFALGVNLITSPGYLWCIFPIFAVWWWPLSLILCRAKKFRLYSIIASIYVTGFFYLVNHISSPDIIWFIYPTYAIVWWPLSMYFAKKSTIKLYSIFASIITLVFLALINYFITPGYVWVQQTIFYFLWWPVITLLGKKAKTLTFSIIGAIIIIAYYVANYLIQTPNIHPWYLYIILPVIWWPVCTAFKNKIFSIKFLLFSLLIFTIYYAMLNFIVSPGYLWIIYLLYPFSWVVMGVYFGRRKKIFSFSVWAAAITILFFSVINYLESPHQIWAVYPSFAILWWPLSQYFYGRREIINLNMSSKTSY